MNRCVPSRSFIPSRTSCLLLVALALLALPVAAQHEQAIPVVDGSTALGLWPEVLGLLDVEWEVVGFTSRLAPHPTSVAAADVPAFAFSGGSLAAVFADGPSPLWRGSIRHHGGLVLRRGDVTVNLVDFQVAEGPEPRTLLVLDAVGRPVFEVRWLHAIAEDGAELRTRNGDLVVTEQLAHRLGVPQAAGRAVGLFESVFRLAAEPTFAPPEDVAGGPPGCNDWSGQKDVALIGIGTVQQVGSEVDGEIVVAGSATLKNVGTGNVPWYSKFSGSHPPYDNDQHPFLVWAMYREVDGIFRQMGVSSIKHAFLTLNFNCVPGACTDGHILGLGCEDVYSVGTNISNGSLAPREEIDPRTGVWAHCDEPEPDTPSHFDQDGNCVQDHFGGGENLFSHGMRIRTDELGVPGASYWFESWYVIRDDINIYNTMGREALDPEFDGTWDFNPSGLITGPAIESWVSLTSPGPGQSNQRHATPNGNVQLAVKTEDLGGGIYRYAYALQNHDLTQGLDAFYVGLPEGAVVQDLQFFDNDGDPANDWSRHASGTLVQWTAPAGGANRLGWGELFAFAFETDRAPLPGRTQSVVADSGTLVNLSGLTPGGASPPGLAIFSDGFESGNTSAWGSTVSP